MMINKVYAVDFDVYFPSLVDKPDLLHFLIIFDSAYFLKEFKDCKLLSVEMLSEKKAVMAVLCL